MTIRPAFLALTMALSLGVSHVAVAQGVGPVSTAGVLAAPRLDIGSVSRLYRQAVIADRVPALYQELGDIAASGAAPERRAMALLARAVMQWQQGESDAALADVNAAIAFDAVPSATLLKAQLLDATGQTSDAILSYKKALSATTDAAERRSIVVRIAMIEAATDGAAISRLADGARPVERMAIASALALRGDPSGALALAGSRTDAGYAHDLRRTGWAMAAGRFDVAQVSSRKAVGHAKGELDRRYAIAVLVEAYRAAGKLADAEAFLATHAADPDSIAARVDILLETGRTDATTALIDRSGDPALRARLLSIFELGGRDQDAAAEYRRRIAAQPDRLEWYQGLALQYLGRGDEAQALEVYRRYFTANAGRIAPLTQAARQMIAMGLATPAARMLERSAGIAATQSAEMQSFMFETARGRGDDTAARAALARWRTILPPASPALTEIADGYERLGDPTEALAVLKTAEARGAALDYDQRVHIASLCFSTGRVEESLNRWRALWRESKLPARRSYLERQIIRSAARLDRLASLAQELEVQIDTGTAKHGDIDLLVGIRLEQGKGDMAVAAVRRYAARAALSDTARLEQLAALYVRLKDRSSLGDVLRQLVRADPRNADLYLRRLTLNTIRYAEGDPAAKQAEIDRLLGELRAAAGLDAADAARFSAGIYAMASLDDRAVVQYHRALAIAPNDGEALVQLANTLKTQKKTDEAVSILQFAADHASDEAGFALAIDALVDIVADLPKRVLSGQVDRRGAVLDWIGRRLFERIVTTGPTTRLDAMLADLAQEQADFALQRRAFDDMLAISGDQKPAMLRQLMTLASGSTGRDGATGPTLGDAAAKRAYGRRLLALRREYPSDFYADLAGAMLAGGDAAGAEQAFAMMTDVGGLVNLDQVKADAYAKAGLPDLALKNYSRALLRDRDDAGLIVKASILREQLGQRALANTWYWAGLTSLILRQPLRSDTGSTETGLDVRQYYATLAEGLLLTWPAAPADRDRIVADLRRMIEDAANRIDPGANRPLEHYPRLSQLVALARRIAEYEQDRERLAALDTLLAGRFGTDVAYQDSVAYWHDLLGMRVPLPSSAGEPDWVRAGIQTQARDSGNVDLDIVLALTSGNAQTITALMTRSIANETRWRDAAKRGDTTQHPPLLYAMLLKGIEALTPEALRSLILEPLSRTPFRNDVMFDVFRTAPDRFERLVTIAPDMVPDNAALIQLMDDDGRPLPMLATNARRRGDIIGGMLKRFSVEEALALYDRYVDAMLATGKMSVMSNATVSALLRADLSAPQRARLMAGIRRDLAYVDSQKRRSAATLVPVFLVLDAPPADRATVIDAATALAKSYPKAAKLPAFLQAFYAGDRTAAFAYLVALFAETSSDGGGVDYATPTIQAHFRKEVQDDIDAFLRAEAPSPERAAMFYDTYVTNSARYGIGSDPATVLPFYRKLVSVDPGNLDYAVGLSRLLWQRTDHAGAAAPLRSYVDSSPTAQDAASVLQMMYAVMGQGADAEAVAQSAGVSIDDPVWLAALFNKLGSGGRIGISSLFADVYDTYRARFPTAPAVLAVERQRASQTTQPTVVPADEVARTKLADAYATSADMGRSVLRGLWRGSAPAGDQPADGLASRPNVVMALIHPALRKTILASPGTIDDLDAFLAALDPEVRQRQPALYALVADGLTASGRAAPRIAAGWAALAAGAIKGHDLQMLLTLLDRQGDVLDIEQRAAIVRGVTAMPILSASQRVQIAGLFARARDYSTAGALLEAATVQTLVPAPVDFSENVASVVSPAIIVGILDGWEDQTAAASTRQTIIARVTLEQGTEAAAALPRPGKSGSAQ
jgi:tetratricopeptide (TPR) repeat protein